MQADYMKRLNLNNNSVLHHSASYHNPYNSLSRPGHSNRATCFSKLLPAFVCVIACVFSLTSRSVQADLKPYKAFYSATFDAGLSIDGEASRELVKTAKGWRLQQKADSFIASIEETSEFSFQGNQIVPQRYEYLHKLMGKERHALLDFDWQRTRVLNDVEGKPWTLKIKPETLDKLNYQLQMRVDLAAGKQAFNYVVADGGNLKNYQFKVVGEETLETALGTIPTLKLERVYPKGKKKQTEIWLAKNMDYLLVRIIQTNKSGNETELVIDRLEN